MTEPILSVRGMSKRFGGLQAVEDVSFDVLPDQVFGIAGPNGSGKSTLFNIITRIPFGATAGTVELDKRQMHGLSPHAIALAGIGRTFQRENIFASLSSIDNVLVAVESQVPAMQFDQKVARAEKMLDMVGFPSTMHNTLAGNLPIYYRKLIMIASAMALKPRVLLMDEPASSLTGPEIDNMKEVVLSIRGAGVAIVLIEHVLSLLMEVSDHLLVLDQGKVIAEGLPAEVIKNPHVVEAYLGGAHV